MSIIPPIEDGFEATLTQKLAASASALTVYVSKVPVATLGAGREVCMTINPKKGFTRQENALIESWNSTTKTLTVKTGGRAQDRYNGDSYSPIEHPVGSKIIISNPYPLWEMLEEKADKTGDTFTGIIDFSGNGVIKLPNLTTAQRDALPTPTNGMKIYNTTTGEEQRYDGGSWVVVASGGTFPNASETVAGKSEQATLAEQIAKTETGGSGAPLFLNPKQISFSSSDAAQGKVAGLNASGKVDSTLIDSSALSVGQTIISLPAGEAVDGTTTPQLVYVSDGTGGRTAGRFYKADADDFTNMATRPIGFVAVNASSVGTSYNVIVDGVVAGFSGLTQGLPYYMSATAGAITATMPSSSVVQIFGRAISTTQLLIEKGQKSIYATYQATLNATGTTTTQISLGFRPRFVFITAYLNSSPAPAAIGFNAMGDGGVVLGSTFAVDTGSGASGAKMTTFDVSGGMTDTTASYFYPSVLGVSTSDATTITMTRTVAGSTSSRTLTVRLYITD